MRSNLRLVMLTLILTGAGNPPALADERVAIDANTDDCTLYRVLNGADAVPAECRFTAKAIFARPAGERLIGVLDTVHFEFNSDRLTPESAEILARIAKVIRNPVSQHQRYQLSGHTDQKGKAWFNRQLSERRARAAKSFLVESGVPADRIAAQGFGSEHLAEPSDPYSAVNRRVEIANAHAGKNPAVETAPERP